MVTQNIHRNSPKGRIHGIRGIEPLVQDTLQVQPVSSSEYSHVGQSITMNNIAVAVHAAIVVVCIRVVIIET